MNDHARAHELLTWQVNGRIAGADAQWLDAHLTACAACRAELAAERRIRDALVREPTVEFAPQASFNRLWSRIEADSLDEPSVPHEMAPAAAPVVEPVQTLVAATSRGATAKRRLWVRVALSAQAAAILLLCGVLWFGPARAPAPAYRTVTDSAAAPASSQPVIKAIFDDQVRLADVKEILGAAGLVVASGPTEAGVYTLSAPETVSAATMQSALKRLRADPRIRFAETGSP